MELRPGYKQTEIGVLPEDWEITFLDQIAEVSSGKRLPAGYYVTPHKTPHPYIRVSDMFAGGVSTENIQYVPVEAANQIKSYRIYKDDIFISVAGTLGIVGCIPEELDGANLTENADRISNIKCDKLFLLYVLRSEIIQKVIESIRTVGAQPKLALERIRKFTIPLPPKKRDMKKAAMQELLTGKTRLPGFNGEWKMFELGKEGELQKENINPQQNPKVFFDEYSMPAFDEGRLPQRVLGETMHSNRTRINGPVLLFNKLNVRQKRVWLVSKTNENSVCSMEFLPYQTSKLDLELLRHILLTDEATGFFESCSTGTSF